MSEPAFIETSTGDQLVILTRTDYDALPVRLGAIEDAEDAADIATGEARLAEWTAAGRPAYPLAVVRLIRDGDHPLRAFRRHKGMTQKELAVRAGFGQGYLSDLEKGRKSASAARLATLAKILETTEASLLPLQA